MPSARHRRRTSSTRPAKAASPQVPTVAATQLLQAALRPDCTPSELAELACLDPGFALRTLQFVNSPMFQRSRPIQDVHQAASLLGVRGLQSLALGLLVSGMVPRAEQARPLLANALRRALAARALGGRASPRLGDVGFTTGLFLEASLLAHASSDLDAASHVAAVPAAARLVLEQAEGLAPHPSAGAKLADHYGLPPELVAAIRTHHDPACPPDDLAVVAWTAEHIASLFEGGNLDEHQDLARTGARTLGLPTDAVDEILSGLPSLVAETAKVFERDVGPQVPFETLLLDANRRLVDMNLQYEGLIRKLERVIAEKESLARNLTAANEQLERLASTDALTGLANRHALRAALDQGLQAADRDRTPLSLVLLDLDRFKQLNDTHGHDVGDEVLRHVARILQHAVRAGDLVARFGGEEFVVVLPGADAAIALSVADRLRAKVGSQPASTGAGPIAVTLSGGVASVVGPGCIDQAHALIKAADEALYEAKRAGRDRVLPGTLGEAAA